MACVAEGTQFMFDCLAYWVGCEAESGATADGKLNFSTRSPLGVAISTGETGGGGKVRDVPSLRKMARVSVGTTSLPEAEAGVDAGVSIHVDVAGENGTAFVGIGWLWSDGSLGPMMPVAQSPATKTASKTKIIFTCGSI